jgi:hypothetical protein
MGTCLICNKNIVGRKRKYCDEECRKKVKYYKRYYEKANERRRKGTKPQRQIWDGDKKICVDCGTPKELAEYHSKGLRNGKRMHSPRCKECMKPRQTTKFRHKNKKLYHFNCKHCGKESTHYDKRYTTFCTRECSFAYQMGLKEYIPKSCERCEVPLGKRNDGYKHCETCRYIILAEKEALKAEKEAVEANLKADRIFKQQEKIRLAREREEARKIERQKRELERRKNQVRKGKYKSKLSLERLYERDKGVCYLCGIKCDFKDFGYKNNGRVTGSTYPTREHVTALANGGTDTWDNIKLACFKCNTEKGTLSLEEVKYFKELEVNLNAETKQKRESLTSKVTN